MRVPVKALLLWGAFSRSAEELLLLCAFGAVLGTGLVAVCNALGVQCTANDVVTNAGQVTYTTAANEDHRVLLQIVPDSGDVAGSFHSVGKTNLCDLTKCRVRLLRGSGGYLGAYTAFLGRVLINGGILQSVVALL